MKSLKDKKIPFLIVWAMAIVLLSAPLSYAAEIVGHWVTKNQTDNNVYFFFGPEDDFFIESETSWIQGTYIVQPDSVPGQLDLYVQDGSNVEDVGKEARYGYDIHDNLLTLSGTVHDGTDRLSTLEVEATAGRDVFTGINTDPPDEDDENNEDVQDDDWVVYASCFVEVLAGILISP